MEILNNDKIIFIQNKVGIKEVMDKISGNNIINFSWYINRFELNKYNQYITYFDKEFDNSKKIIIFEFLFISLVIMERENLCKFGEERR